MARRKSKEPFDCKDRYKIENGCWVWIAAKDNRGYGQIKMDGILFRAHGLFYELYQGPIPEGYVIHHKCFNPSCVNPKHLEAISDHQHRKMSRWYGPRPKISPGG